MTKLPSTIDLRAELFEFTVPDIAATDANGKRRMPTFAMAAYSGGPMQLGWSGVPTILNASGVRHAGKVPVLIEHGYAAASKARSALGHTTKVTTEGGRIAAEGVVSGVGEEVEHCMAMARNGFPFQASVGVTVDRDAVQFIAEGQTVKANGQTFKGPCYYAASGQLREISIVVLGADPETETRIAAQKQRTATKMIPTTTTETPPTAPAVIGTVGPVESERARIREIMAAFRDLGADAERDQFIASGASVAEANARALHLLRASRPNVGGPVVLQSRHAEDAKTISAGVARFLGASDKAIEAAKLPVDCEVPTSLLDIAERVVRAERGELPSGRDRVIQAAFSSNSFASTLSTALSVVALDRWTTSPEPALRLVRRVPVNDFKPTTLARLDGRFKLEEVGDAGELKHGVVGGPATTVALRTHGKIVVLTRKDIINDDAGMLAGVPAELGAEAARSVGDEFAGKLYDEAFFSAGNANLMTGGSSALSITSLGTAVAKLRDQQGSDGRRLNLPPAFLLVGSGLEMTARAILNSAEVGRDDGGPSGNPVRNVAELLVDSRLPASQWWLFAPVSTAAFVLATLRGVEAPTVEPVEPPSDRLGAGWRAFFDFGIAAHEPRAAVRSFGA